MRLIDIKRKLHVLWIKFIYRNPIQYRIALKNLKRMRKNDWSF